METKRLFYRPAEIAEMYGVAVRQLSQLVARGVLAPPIVISRKTILYAAPKAPKSTTTEKSK